MSPLVMITVVILLIALFGGGYGYRSGNCPRWGRRHRRVNTDHPPYSVLDGPAITVSDSLYVGVVRSCVIRSGRLTGKNSDHRIYEAATKFDEG